MAGDGWRALPHDGLTPARDAPEAAEGRTWYEVALASGGSMVVELPEESVDAAGSRLRLDEIEGALRTADLSLACERVEESPVTCMPRRVRDWSGALGEVEAAELALAVFGAPKPERPPRAVARPERHAPSPVQEKPPTPVARNEVGLPADAPMTATVTIEAGGEAVSYRSRVADLAELARILSGTAAQPEQDAAASEPDARPVSAEPAETWYDLARERLIDNAADDRRPSAADFDRR